MPSEDRLKKVTAGIESDDSWSEPVSLDSVKAAPPFPVDALSPWMQDFVCSAAEAHQVPADLPASLALATIATCVGGLVDLEVKENYPVTLNGWFVTAMSSGERKSPVFSKSMVPLHLYEADLLDRAIPEIRRAKAAKELADARAKQAMHDAMKPKGDKAEADDYAMRCREEAEAMVVPADPLLLVDDVSPEVLGQILADQAGRIALVSEEGGVFDAMSGRYDSNKKGGASASLDVFLKGYDGGDLRVHRMGRPPNIVPHAYLTIGVTVQPSVIQGLMSDKQFKGRGLLGRFFYSVPQSMVGRRNVRALPFSDEMQQAWNRRVLAMAKTYASGGQIKLSPEAVALLDSFEESYEGRLEQTADLAQIADWMNKLAGRVAKLAGWLHLCDHYDSGWQRPVDAKTMERAIQIGHYYWQHALVAYDLMGSDENRDRMRFILRLFEAQATEFVAEVFTRQAVMRAGSRSSLPNAEVTQIALDQLEHFGWIKKVGTTSAHTYRYRLHPDFLEIRGAGDSGPTGPEPEPVEDEPEVGVPEPAAVGDAEAMVAEAFPESEVVDDPERPDETGRLAIVRSKLGKLDRTDPRRAKVRDKAATIREAAGVDPKAPIEPWMCKNGELAALEALLEDVVA